jgi:hypothetical protein
MKISALVGGLVAIVLLFIFRYSVDLGMCNAGDYYCVMFYNNLELSLYIAPIFTFFAMVTIFSKEPFRFWFPFAIIAAPIIFIISVIVRSGFHHTVGGFMNIESDIDAFFILFLYALFTLVSVVQIIRGALHGKGNAKK